MSFIDYFGRVIKPNLYRGAGYVNPIDTKDVFDDLKAVRQDDVNFWIYHKDGKFIAIDSGYANFPNVNEQFKKINLDNNLVEAVFLTHADIDHFGGIADSKDNIFPNAKVYLGEDEEDMLHAKIRRFDYKIIGFKNPIKREKDYTLLKDGQVILVGNIEIECIFLMGHTKGHVAYLVDKKYLFTGDSIALNENGGYSFFKASCMDVKQNVKSLEELKIKLAKRMPKAIFTGHNGFSTDASKFFLHTNEIAYASKKKVFDKSAPYDIYAEKK